MPTTETLTPHADTELAKDAIPEELVDLLEELACTICREPISRYEMAAVWAAGDFVAHLPCWAQHKGVICNAGASS
jgi:hypothetical protein